MASKKKVSFLSLRVIKICSGHFFMSFETSESVSPLASFAVQEIKSHPAKQDKLQSVISEGSDLIHHYMRFVTIQKEPFFVICSCHLVYIAQR